MSISEQQAQQRLHICITGSSAGIGLAAAKRLVADGHVVYHACRSLERAKQAVQLAGGGIPIECDLANLDSVVECANKLQEMERLDVLCLNAGVALSASVPRLTRQGFEETIGVNHIGHFVLANLMYKKLKANGGGRLVVTASSVHDPETPGGKSSGKTATLGDLSGLGVNLKITPTGAAMIDGVVQFDGPKAYKDSKLCNILFSRQAVKAFPGLSVRVVNPGFVPTTGLFDSMRQESYWRAQALTLFAYLSGFSMPVEVGGDRLVYVATTQDWPKNGAYFSAEPKVTGTTPESGFVETQVSKEASRDDLAEKLWEKTKTITKEWVKQRWFF